MKSLTQSIYESKPVWNKIMITVGVRNILVKYPSDTISALVSEEFPGLAIIPYKDNTVDFYMKLRTTYDYIGTLSPWAYDSLNNTSVGMVLLDCIIYIKNNIKNIQRLFFK